MKGRRANRYQDDDTCHSSSSSDGNSNSNGSSGSDDDSPTPSDLNINNSGRGSAVDNNKRAPPDSMTWDSMDGYEIRQNARNLLNSSTAAISESNNDNKKNGLGERKMNSIIYQSYQEPPRNMDPITPQFSNLDASSSVSPWGDNRCNNASDDNDGLSVYHVASMALNCMVNCFTEGYRAASTYYNNSYPENSYSPSIGGFHNTSYQDVGSYYNESRSQQHNRQVMDREQPHPRATDDSKKERRCNYQNQPNGSGERIIGQMKGDYATVKIPSYQGRK